jgi:NRAMP (natural resistance-associated macrophage protein)-like metal ion transporter
MDQRPTEVHEKADEPQHDFQARYSAFEAKLNEVRRYLKILGPGLITGAADDDPSGISTYSVAGATTGLSMLWLALLTTPMMAVVQGMCARIGMVSGKGLAAVLRSQVPGPLLYAVAAMVVVANTFNIGADIAGMAASMQMVAGFSVLFWVFVSGAALIGVQVFLSYAAFVRVIKWLCLALFAYVATAFVVKPNWGTVLLTSIVPHISLTTTWITTMVAVLGTTISPYLFFWQSSLMVEEEKAIGRTTQAARRGATADEIRDAHADVNTGMLFSNLVMFFIIVTTATTLGAHGKHDIATAQQAAEALRPLAGDFAYLLFTLGMVGTGLLAVPSLAGSSAYLISDIFRFRQGLDEKPRRAPKFYAAVVAGIVVGVVMNVAHVDPIKALYWSAVANGVASVPLVILVTILANDKRVMGKWRNSWIANIWSGLAIVTMTGAAILLFAYWGKS